jgi:hypothetical protein
MAQENRDADSIRREHIAVAAYYRAERRGFEPPGELDDWLEAERQIDSMASAKGVKSEASQRGEPLSEAGLGGGDHGDVLRTGLEHEHIDPADVHQWAERLKVSPTLLREAIKRAGPVVRDVKNELDSIRPVGAAQAPVQPSPGTSRSRRS